MVINSNKEANEILDTESKLSEPAAGVEKGLSIWQLAFPSILGNLSYTLVGMVQVKFVGELGTGALAAMGAGSRVFFALQSIIMAISAGTTALVLEPGARAIMKKQIGDDGVHGFGWFTLVANRGVWHCISV